MPNWVNLSQEDRKELFDKWVAEREARANTTAAKKAATKELIELHREEYDELIKRYGGVVKRHGK